MKGLEGSITLGTATGFIARAFGRALREGYKPDTFGALGPPGAGKTASLRDMAHEHGWAHVSIPMGNKEPPDLQGLMSLDERDPRFFKYRAPEWAQGLLAGQCDRPTVVVLDDFPHAQKQVQAGALKLVHEHQFGDTTPLDNKVLFVLSGNRLEDNAGAGALLSPVRSRVRWFQVHPDSKEWLDRCPQWGIHFKVRAWVARQENYFCAYKHEQFTYPCPRSHHMLSNAQHEADGVGAGLTQHEAGGIVGDEAGAAYLMFCRAEHDMVDPELVLKDPAGVDVNSRNLDAFYMLVKALEAKAEADPDRCWRPIVEFAVRKDLGKGDLLGELGEHAMLRAVNKGTAATSLEVAKSAEYKRFSNRFRSLVHASQLAKQLGGGE